jgi:hypothetical protein
LRFDEDGLEWTLFFSFFFSTEDSFLFSFTRRTLSFLAWQSSHFFLCCLGVLQLFQLNYSSVAHWLWGEVEDEELSQELA